MNTFKIIIAACKSPTLKVWGCAQKAHGNGRISFRELGEVQKELRKNEPSFFGG